MFSGSIRLIKARFQRVKRFGDNKLGQVLSFKMCTLK